MDSYDSDKPHEEGNQGPVPPFEPEENIEPEIDYMDEEFVEPEADIPESPADSEAVLPHYIPATPPASATYGHAMEEEPPRPPLPE